MNTDTATLSIPADSASIASARKFTESFLRTRGLEGLVDTMVLLVSEVVTNAIIHGGSAAELCLMQRGNSIRAEVRDGSQLLPAVKQYSDSATTGRGMLIVESLASSWGTETQEGGKVVWFAVDAATSADHPAETDSSGAPLPSLTQDSVISPVRSTNGGDLQDNTQNARVLVSATF